MEELLDATVLIDFLNDVPSAVSYLTESESQKFCISSVTLAEVLVGCSIQEQEKFLYFSKNFRFLDVTRDIAIIAAKLRQEFRWKLPDAFQAALAIHHKINFVTRNTKDFDPKIHKFVKVPYRLKSRS